MLLWIWPCETCLDHLIAKVGPARGRSWPQKRVRVPETDLTMTCVCFHRFLCSSLKPSLRNHPPSFGPKDTASSEHGLDSVPNTGMKSVNANECQIVTLWSEYRTSFAWSFLLNSLSSVYVICKHLEQSTGGNRVTWSALALLGHFEAPVPLTPSWDGHEPLWEVTQWVQGSEKPTRQRPLHPFIIFIYAWCMKCEMTRITDGESLERRRFSALGSLGVDATCLKLFSQS